MADELQAAVEALKNKAMEQVGILKAYPEMHQLIKFHTALNTLEGVAGIPTTSLSSLFGLESGEAAAVARSLVSPGEFFGKAPLEAAKLFLRKKGKPATLDEIVENLALGSCEVRNRGDLRVSLGRSTFEIARLGEDQFGLLDWYPDVKQARMNAASKRRGSGESPQPVAENSDQAYERSLTRGDS